MKCMVFVACSMAQSKEETAFFPLESLTTVLHKLSTKEFASERVRHSAIRNQIQSLFAVTCLNQNSRTLLRSLTHFRWLYDALQLCVLCIFIVIITITLNVVK